MKDKHDKSTVDAFDDQLDEDATVELESALVSPEQFLQILQSFISGEPINMDEIDQAAHVLHKQGRTVMYDDFTH